MSVIQLPSMHEQGTSLVDSVGFGVIESNPDIASLTGSAVEFGRQIGANHIGRLVLQGEGSGEWLLKHTEGIIFNEDSLLQYFALGCLEKAATGGRTFIYDARVAASLIDTKYPELADVRTKYISTVYEGQQSEHSLVTDDEQYGRVLRYRSKASTNIIVAGLPESMSEDDYYETIEVVLDESIIATHQWTPGELVVVNNHITLHSREPYEGPRKMVRFRFDDPNFKTIPVPIKESA